MIRTRYRQIVFFFARKLLAIAFWDLLLPRVGLRSWSRRNRTRRLRSAAADFRALAVKMGGVLIKVGQFLSTRVDVLPAEIISELEGLQDEVPPVPYEDIRRVAEAELNAPLSSRYARFETTPLAAASLGQVHRAWLRQDALRSERSQSAEETDPSASAAFGALSVPEAAQVEAHERRPSTTLRMPQASALRMPEDTLGMPGEEELVPVVVKIQRPDIAVIIDTDLAALATVSRWLDRYPPIRRRADVPALLKEFARILYGEIDYLAEGRNAETFAANFAGDSGVRVPEVYWTHTTRRVLTLENVWAIKITDYEAITAAGVDRAEVATRLIDTYLQQIFEDGFFHADPHPGNLFIDPLDETGDWQLTFVDFGMVGQVPEHLREGLREMLIGVGTQDPARVVHSYQLLGVLLPSADLSLLEQAEEQMFARFWGKTMNELRNIDPQEIRAFAHEFRDLLFSLPFQVPQDLIFLGRTVGILSGLCTGLDPEFNIWEHLVPFARRMIAQEARPVSESLLNELTSMARTLVSVPRKMDTLLTRIDRGEIAVRAPEISRQVNQLERALHQVARAIVFMALLLGGIQLYLGGSLLFAEILLGASGLTLIWFVFSGR